MISRRMGWALTAVMVWVVALHGAALPGNSDPDLLPVRGSLMPMGDFVGTLQIVACTVDAAGQLNLTGVLTGTATPQTASRIQVTAQPFTVPATLHDPGHTTDVVQLALAPISLDHMGIKIKLAPLIVDVYALPDVGNELARLLPPPGMHGPP